MAAERIVVLVEVVMAVAAIRDCVLAAGQLVPALVVVWYCFEQELRSALHASPPLQPPSTSVPV